MGKFSLFSLAFSASQNLAQTVWTVGKTTFIEGDGTDFSLEVNLDKISDELIITQRNDGRQIFNIALESIANKDNSPEGTQWIIGTTENIENLNFTKFREIGKPKEMINIDLVLYLVNEDIYTYVKIY